MPGDIVARELAQHCINLYEGIATTVVEVAVPVEVIDAAALRGGRFADRLYLGLFEGADLAGYVRVVIEKQRNLSLAPRATAEAIADLIGEAGPADVNEIISKAVNYTLTDMTGGARQRAVTLNDVRRAVSAMRQ